MPAITFNDFSGGLDRRLPINVQEANRLWVLRNAYITLGKRIKKRPGLAVVSNGLSGSFGLEAVNGSLTVFASVGSTFVAPAGVTLVSLTLPAGYAADSLLDVTYADTFSGFPYVVGFYHAVATTEEHISLPPPGRTGFGTITIVTVEGRAYRHHYVDGSPSTLIADVNCPSSPSVTKAASRVFATDGEVVRYCKAGDPRDWTAASDAGFLPVSLQQDTKTGCTAVGSFANSLVVFFPEGAQIWTVAVDPGANEIDKRIEGVGTEQALTLAGFASDLMFLSQYGFRSMTVQAMVDRIDDTDVGVAVDKLVVPDIAALPVNTNVLGLWIHEFGQYWAVFNNGVTSKAWVYNYSKSSKLACWSEYTFPILITAMCTRGGKVYARTAEDLYQFSDIQYTDEGTTISVEVQMAFQNAKTPGVEKQFYGADFVFEGTADVSYLYDPRDTSKETISQAVDGDTAAGVMVGVEVTAASIAPVVRHAADEAFEFSQASLYYHPLGVT